jgi:hypothetical protein
MTPLYQKKKNGIFQWYTVLASTGSGFDPQHPKKKKIVDKQTYILRKN